MNGYDNEYKVNLAGFNRWEGKVYETKEEAVEAARVVLKEKDLLDSSVFGSSLGNKLPIRDGEYVYPETFLLGKVKRLSVPEKLGYSIIDDLDEIYWEDETYGGDYPSKYVFREEDKERFDRMITDFIRTRVDASGYYTVEILGEVKVR